ncbi:CDP-glycerol glycerophosphotransferase [Allocatelliglobosispora scoriae]|uniref:CDP-glycerol glycerophosphotransferase n=1 Tax=Allocatelliglobosispora scoriae TaxID=643052 RepID=A0A841BT79_9ACTN|nr:bifunctional glycosyltransferase family 2 protein/CDP-glycerol:glycerophosphate glycerophosphotransferase [Allocatelliglobosispora scoriae]MBB5870616.1 CDP-glycerol glycerophosphotransferase [Allocatelliglobosispora scoriae]
MPLLSVIVPVYKVQGYLRQCLDSVLEQGFRDIELIVVNDCSPDRSGEIIDEIAARDSRVRPLHLERNVGLGHARNAGLAVATGDYVWFLDSDDWLSEGCLAEVAARLTDGLDMLVVDYSRADPTGPLRRSWAAKEVATIPEGEVFRAVDRPEILRIVHFAWNRVLRRQFLIEHRLDHFFEGWYEDISWSFPAMAAAERISFLNLSCVNYRQRRGSITKSSGDRHLEFFDQWIHAFERIDRADPLWEQIFARFVWHTLMVLENATRLPDRAARRKFFTRGTEVYHAYAPAEPISPAVRKLHWWEKNKAEQAVWLAKGDFGSFERKHVARQFLKRNRSRARRAVKVPGTLISTVWGWKLGIIGRTYYEVEARLPVDPQLAVFDSYWGLGFGCNPAAIYRKTRELAPDLHAVFVVRPDRTDAMPADVPYVVRGTLDYYRTLARAKYLTTNVNFPNFVRKRRGSVHLQTQHGTPLKSMGIDQQRYPAGEEMDHDSMLRRIDRWDYCISSNPLSTEVWERSFPAAYEQLEVGYPRNDRLATATPEEVAKVRAELGIDPQELVVLYAPTHRSHDPASAPPFDPEQLLHAIAPHGCVLLRDHHLVTYAAGGDEDEPTSIGHAAREVSAGRVMDVSTHPRIEDLYLAADALIVDYSSAMFDYAVLDRPIVVYAPDWAEYSRARGVNFDLLEHRPGAVAMSFDELCEIFAGGRWADADAAAARAAFRARFCPWDDGRAAERVVRRVFLGESVETPQVMQEASV